MYWYGMLVACGPLPFYIKQLNQTYRCLKYYYRAMLRHGKSSVFPSARRSMTLRYRDHRLEYFKDNVLLVWLGCPLSADPNITDLLQGEHPKFWQE